MSLISVTFPEHLLIRRRLWNTKANDGKRDRITVAEEKQHGHAE